MTGRKGTARLYLQNRDYCHSIVSASLSSPLPIDWQNVPSPHEVIFICEDRLMALLIVKNKDWDTFASFCKERNLGDRALEYLEMKDQVKEMIDILSDSDSDEKELPSLNQHVFENEKESLYLELLSHWDFFVAHFPKTEEPLCL